LPSALPPSVRHFEFVSLKLLLPHCAAIVHHGGIGTVAKALATGTPQLIIPHAWDQLDNAKRVEQLGAGKWLKRRQATSARIATALVPLMSDDSHARCREIARNFDEEEALLRAAQWIEELT
jgi:rhamnosyltransferase subunit B